MPIALETANSALKAFSAATGMIANNLSNQNTVGYKDTQVMFSSQVTGTSANTRTGSVRPLFVENTDQQGLLQTSSQPTHLSISGNGFFVISSSKANEDYLYTRAGHFVPDLAGDLQNGAGFYLQGWETDEDGNVPDAVNTGVLTSLKTINVSRVTGFSKPTTSINLAANLNSATPAGETYDINVQIYDTLGAEHTLQMRWTAVSPGVWDLTVTCPEATTINMTDPTGADTGVPYTNMRVQFDGTGAPTQFNNDPSLILPPGLFVTWDPAITNAGTLGMELNVGALGTLTGITARSGDSNTTKVQQDGRRFGTLSGVSVNDDGIVSALFNNGETLKIARVAVANFAAPSQLEQRTGNAWIQTDLSGNYVLSFAKVGGLGKVVSNSLENSTVDTAQQLTALIGMEQAYAANATVINKDAAMFDSLLSNIR
ncbi:MAG: flagellar hook protein FlgE [Holosporales bacterium]